MFTYARIVPIKCRPEARFHILPRPSSVLRSKLMDVKSLQRMGLRRRTQRFVFRPIARFGRFGGHQRGHYAWMRARAWRSFPHIALGIFLKAAAAALVWPFYCAPVRLYVKDEQFLL